MTDSWEELAALSIEDSAPSGEKPGGEKEMPLRGSEQVVQQPASAPSNEQVPLETVEVDIALKQALSGDSRAWGEREH